MKDPNRTALLVRCSEEEARFIREAAQREHRTLSGYILVGLCALAAWLSPLHCGSIVFALACVIQHGCEEHAQA